MADDKQQPANPFQQQPPMPAGPDGNNNLIGPSSHGHPDHHLHDANQQLGLMKNLNFGSSYMSPSSHGSHPGPTPQLQINLFQQQNNLFQQQTPPVFNAQLTQPPWVASNNASLGGMSTNNAPAYMPSAAWDPNHSTTSGPQDFPCNQPQNTFYQSGWGQPWPSSHTNGSWPVAQPTFTGAALPATSMLGASSSFDMLQDTAIKAEFDRFLLERSKTGTISQQQAPLQEQISPPKQDPPQDQGAPQDQGGAAEKSAPPNARLQGHSNHLPDPSATPTEDHDSGQVSAGANQAILPTAPSSATAKLAPKEKPEMQQPHNTLDLDTLRYLDSIGASYGNAMPPTMVRVFC